MGIILYVLLVVNVNRNKLNVNGSKCKCTCNIVIFKELILGNFRFSNLTKMAPHSIHIGSYENVTFNVTLSNCKYNWEKCKYQYILCYNCKYGYNFHVVF